jgi:hypothetical protein
LVEEGSMNPLWFIAGVATGWVLLGLLPTLRPLAEELEATGNAVYKQLQALVASPTPEPGRPIVPGGSEVQQLLDAAAAA